MTTVVIRKGQSAWSQMGGEATARGIPPEKFDVMCWGDDFGAVARFNRGPTDKMIQNAFHGLAFEKMEKR